jgi:ribosomal protein S18 acetylase RimI-like enzyme
MVVIKPITVEAALTLKAIRLRALLDTPKAFGSTYARESRFSDAEWEDRARRWTDDRSACYLALEDGEACGIAAGLLDKQDSTQAHLVSMWIAPTHRGGGIGRRLVMAVLDWAASQHADTLRLMVVSNNAPAIGFYRRLGFAPTGET